MHKENLVKISSFLSEHHVMSLATCTKDSINSCNLFYAYDGDNAIFVIASNDDTQHIQDIKLNPNISGTVVLETKTVGKIQGVQFRGEFSLLENESLKKLYFKNFPYAISMNPKLWKIEVNYFKLTDNRLGFGKKVIWER